MLIDASQPLTEQDQRVLSMVIEAGRALVLAFNKWDLVDEDRRDLLEREIHRELVQVRWWAPGSMSRPRPGGPCRSWCPRWSWRWSRGTPASRRDG